MLRRTLLAVAVLVFSGFVGQAARAQSNFLPGIGADGFSLPLGVDQLDESERAAYALLPAGSPVATRFLFTRGYFRYCRLVSERQLEASRLPPLPPEERWDRTFLSAEEGRIADHALGLWMISTMRPPR